MRNKYFATLLFSLLIIQTGVADQNGICLVPWTSDGTVDIRGRMNDDLLTVSQGVQVTLACRPLYTVTNGAQTSICGSNNQWSPKLGICTQIEAPTTSPTIITAEMTSTVISTESTTFTSTPRPRFRSGPPQPACGLSKYPFAGTRTQRILGQLPALKNEFPWQARLVSGPRTNTICDGAIVNRYFVLTTASCVSAVTDSDGPVLKIYVGGNRMDVTDSTERSYEVVGTKIHPLYQERNRDYNFALLKVADPMPLNDNINKVCLLPKYCQGESKPGTYCAVSGWRKADPNNTGELQKNVARIGWQFECATIASRDTADFVELTDRQLCAGFPVIPFDSRYETPDNGQPLVCQSASGNFYLNGIFSHRRQLASQADENSTIIAKLVIDIYARPCSVMDWIERIVYGQRN